MSLQMQRKLSAEESENLFKILKTRFEKNKNRHEGLEWPKVQAKLEANPKKLWSLDIMEETGGEPDVVGFDEKRKNLYSTIVPLKARKNAEVFVMTTKRW